MLAVAGVALTACGLVSGLHDYSNGSADASAGGGSKRMDAEVDSPSETPDEGTAPDDESDANETGDDEASGDDGGLEANTDGSADASVAADASDSSSSETGDGRASSEDASDSAPPTEAGTVQCQFPVVHNDGVGQIFTDCAPLNTYNVVQAEEACTASTGDAGACSTNTGACQVLGGETVVCSDTCDCWGYTSSAEGHVNTGGLGHVCTCPGAVDPLWN